MKYAARVTYRSFPPCPPSMDVTANGATVDAALEDMFRAFNHAFPGVTGELAERFKVRSMSVGDEVSIDGRTYVCAPRGFVDVAENPGILNDFLVKISRESRT